MKWFLLLSFLISSCGFKVDKMANNGQAVSFTDQELQQPTFSVISQKIFQVQCINCHGAGGTAARVPLEPKEELLNSPLDLVIPGEPNKSGLVIAITRADGKRMPPPKDGPALSTIQIAVIKKWIEQGASQ